MYRKTLKLELEYYNACDAKTSQRLLLEHVERAIRDDAVVLNIRPTRIISLVVEDNETDASRLAADIMAYMGTKLSVEDTAEVTKMIEAFDERHA